MIERGGRTAAGASGAGGPALTTSPTDANVALFLDSTEAGFCIGDKLAAASPHQFSQPPSRYFVKDADDAHERLLAGTNPIVGMSLDDVISLSESGDPRAADLVVIGGVHGGFLQLMAEPRIDSAEQLRGTSVAVDTDTGYASALFEILRRAGLERGTDYSVVYAGATNVRYDKLLSGEFAATLLGAPFTDLAASKGYNSLGSVSRELGSYQGVVLVSKRSWLDSHGHEARRALATLEAAIDWAQHAPESELVEYVKACVPAVGTEAEAAQVARTLFGPDSDYNRGCRITDANLRVVINLYNKSRGTSISEGSVHALIDYSYLPEGRTDADASVSGS